MGRGAIGNLSYIDGKTPLVGLPLEQIRATTLQLSQQYHENIAKNDEFAIKAAQINTMPNEDDEKYMKEEINKAQNQVYDKVKSAGGWQHAGTAVSNATVGLLTGDIYKATQQRLGEYTAYQEKIKESDATEEYKAKAIALSLNKDRMQGGLKKADGSINNRFTPFINLGKGHDTTELTKQMMDFSKGMQEGGSSYITKYVETNKLGQIIKDFANSDLTTAEERAEWLGMINGKNTGISQDRYMQMMLSVLMTNTNAVAAKTTEARIDLLSSGIKGEDLMKNYVEEMLKDSIMSDTSTRKLLLKDSISYNNLSDEQKKKLKMRLKDKKDLAAIKELTQYLTEGSSVNSDKLQALSEDEKINRLATSMANDRMYNEALSFSAPMAYNKHEQTVNWLKAGDDGSGGTGKKANTSFDQTTSTSQVPGELPTSDSDLNELANGINIAQAELETLITDGKGTTARAKELELSIKQNTADLYNKRINTASAVGQLPKDTPEYKKVMNEAVARLRGDYLSVLEVERRPISEEIKNEMSTILNTITDPNTLQEAMNKLNNLLDINPSTTYEVFYTGNHTSTGMPGAYTRPSTKKQVNFNGSDRLSGLTTLAKASGITSTANNIISFKTTNDDESSYRHILEGVMDAMIVNGNGVNVLDVTENGVHKEDYTGKLLSAYLVKNSYLRTASKQGGKTTEYINSSGTKDRCVIENTNDGSFDLGLNVTYKSPSTNITSNLILQPTDAGFKSSMASLNNNAREVAYKKAIKEVDKGITYNLISYKTGLLVDGAGVFTESSKNSNSETPDLSNSKLSTVIFKKVKAGIEEFNIELPTIGDYEPTIHTRKIADNTYQCNIIMDSKDQKIVYTFECHNNNFKDVYSFIGESMYLKGKQGLVRPNKTKVTKK